MLIMTTKNIFVVFVASDVAGYPYAAEEDEPDARRIRDAAQERGISTQFANGRLI
jgi:hypothetical protein